MFLTEEQAREKWCPHVRTVESMAKANSTVALGISHPRNVVVQMDEAYNITDTHRVKLAGCQCIASDCSQWQLAALVHDHDAKTFAEFYFSTEEQRTMWARQFDGIDSVTVTLCGYCGLAGKP